MTLDEQTQKEFETIAPKWAELYKMYRFGTFNQAHFCKDNLCKVANHNDMLDIDTQLSLGDSRCCILGEAFLFKDQTFNGCENCELFSMALYGLGKTINNKFYRAIDDESFEKALKAFLKHFNENHSDLIKA